MALSFKYDAPGEEITNEDGSVSPIPDIRIYDSEIATTETLSRVVNRLMGQGYDLQITIKCKIPKG